MILIVEAPLPVINGTLRLRFDLHHDHRACIPRHDPKLEKQIRDRWKRLEPTLDERTRRLFAASEAAGIGYGGVAAAHRATGLARSTIERVVQELANLDQLAPPKGMKRRPGAGRPKLTDVQPGLDSALDALIEPGTRGDPESLLRWLSMSARNIVEALNAQGWRAGRTTVLSLLRERGFTLQKTRKVLEGSNHPDRNAQFEHLNAGTSEWNKIEHRLFSFISLN